MPTKFTRSYSLTWTPKGRTAKKGTPGGRKVFKTGSQALTALTSGLGMMPEAVQENGKALVTEFANRHSEKARGDAPRATGYMDQTFGTDVQTSKLSAKSSSWVSAFYAAYQEFGFHHWRNGAFQRPKPFMFPAFASLKSEFMDRARKVFG